MRVLGTASVTSAILITPRVPTLCGRSQLAASGYSITSGVCIFPVLQDCRLCTFLGPAAAVCTHLTGVGPARLLWSSCWLHCGTRGPNNQHDGVALSETRVNIEIGQAPTLSGASSLCPVKFPALRVRP